MNEASQAIVQFAFILFIPLLVVGGGLVTLFAVGALFDALENPGELKDRLDRAFRRPPKDPKAPGPGHYYKPYWQSQKTP
jgi:hypothetical protein